MKHIKLFEEFTNSIDSIILSEGTWAMNKSKIKPFIKDLKKVKVAAEITKLKNKYYHHVGDDDLFDNLDRAESSDNIDSLQNNIADAIGRLEDFLNEAKHIKLFEQFISEARYTKLESVGSIIDQDGMVYPMTVSGKPDLDNGTLFDEIDREDDWYSSLSTKDRKIVAQYESLTEKQFKGLDGIDNETSLTEISDKQKLKIIQSTGNIISFFVPDGFDRNFWQVISTGKIKKGKSLSGDVVYTLPGKMIGSPQFKSEKDLIDGVDWESVEQARRFNE